MLSSTKERTINLAELTVIAVCAFLPIFFSLSYRINIFLSWEGAYRLYLGQIPFRDFGLPMGFGYWIIPAVFFKIFGPYLATLVKAQIFINLVSGVTFRAILNLFKIDPFKRLCSVVVYCLTFILGNLWPWYNHSVIVFELIGLYFILSYILKSDQRFRIVSLIAGCFFLFLSFFTKQDAGALSIMLGASLMLYYAIIKNSFKPIGLFVLIMAGMTLLFILPFIQYDFFYWFNLGQPPHNSRVSIRDFAAVIFGESRWEKFYFLPIAGIVYFKFHRDPKFYLQKKEMIFVLLTLGILVEALLFQVTSYVPKNNNIFFHSFCFAFILANVNIDTSRFKLKLAPIVLIFVLFWWSETFWKYLDRMIVSRLFPHKVENITGNVGMGSFVLPTPCDTLRYSDQSTWTFSKYTAFQKVMMPMQTVTGIDYIMNMDVIRKKKSATKVLNMSELTPLAHEIGYELEKNQPLWYHHGVGIFDKEIDVFCNRIKNNYYDVVIFENIPGLNNFYPFIIRDCLLQNYSHSYTFKAPRSDFQGFVEIYVPKTTETPIAAR
jgi:hypothetical protein